MDLSSLSDFASQFCGVRCFGPSLLSQWTTFRTGGAVAAAIEVPAAQAPDIAQIFIHAKQRGILVQVLGDGSNVIAPDAGLDAILFRLAEVRDGVCIEYEDDRVIDIAVDGGLGWDALVDWSVQRNLWGLECLSGIPGRVGAAPIQNIGAYGQSLSDTLMAVECVDRNTGKIVTFKKPALGLSYRDSHFKGEWRDQYVITRLWLRLSKHCPWRQPTSLYQGLRARLASVMAADGESWRGTMHPASLRAAVLQERSGKGMLLDDADSNTYSAGSFFMNPLLSQESFVALQAHLDAYRSGLSEQCPKYPSADHRVKTSAAWLIDRAGFHKGYRFEEHGAPGIAISDYHSLALCNAHGGTTAGIQIAAAVIQKRVSELFGCALSPEPTFLK